MIREPRLSYLIKRLPEKLLESRAGFRQEFARPIAEHRLDLGSPAIEQTGLRRVAHDLKAQRIVSAFPRLDYHRVSQQPRKHGEIFDDSVPAQQQHRFANRVGQRHCGPVLRKIDQESLPH